ncbi:FUSC family protein [Cryobacterium sp. TMT1-66-1]|nr:FUSC family protein [Cryobacterium sp. TMT1-66-1]
MTGTTLASVTHTAWQLKSQITRSRMLQAGKAAVAVGISWSIAPHLPGVADNYPYYAPLGALVSMYPTLMGSVRNALQTLGSLVVGIVLAAAVLVLSQPNVVTISVAVGIGALIAATGWFGNNREYIPVTVLFVLIVGGPDADSYSIGYIVQISLGIVIGLLVNMLVFPALNLNGVGLKLSNYRSALADHLSEVAEALAEHWPPERDGWASRKDSLINLSSGLRTALQQADESRKVNPRARIHRHRDLSADYEDLAALETIAFHVRDLTEVLAGAVWGTPIKVELREDLRPSVSLALDAMAAALRDWDAGNTDLTAHAAAADALASLMAELDDRKDSTSATSMGAAISIAMDIARALAALLSRLESPATDD